ncbi:3'-5' exonuclease [Candidatus Phytoplasma pyri]|uniref:3'-5' exonuclease n=1 Tax=Candidatus Phytoplasma pyri TaxID=47566 RepID=UPI003982E505
MANQVNKNQNQIDLLAPVEERYNRFPPEDCNLKFSDLKTDNSGTELTPAVVQAYKAILTRPNFPDLEKTQILNKIKYCKVTQIGNKKVVKIISQKVRNYIYNHLSLNKIVSGIVNYVKFDPQNGYYNHYFFDKDKLSQKKALQHQTYLTARSLDLGSTREINHLCINFINQHGGFKNEEQRETIRTFLKEKCQAFEELLGPSYANRFKYRLYDLQQIVNHESFNSYHLPELIKTGIIKNTDYEPLRLNFHDNDFFNCGYDLIQQGNTYKGFQQDYLLKDATYVIFDLETTGLNSEYDRIIEIAGVKIKNNVVIEEFSSLVNPQRVISSKIEAITHIKNADVQGQPLISEILPRFLEFCHDSILVAHNARFDYSFIKANYYRCYQKPLTDMPYIDTLNLAKFYFMNKANILKNKLQGHLTLKNLAYHFKVKLVNHHRALCDVYATKEIFIKMLHFLNREQITHYQQLHLYQHNNFARHRVTSHIKKVAYDEFYISMKKYLSVNKVEKNITFTDFDNQKLFNFFKLNFGKVLQRYFMEYQNIYIPKITKFYLAKYQAERTTYFYYQAQINHFNKVRKLVKDFDESERAYFETIIFKTFPENEPLHVFFNLIFTFNYQNFNAFEWSVFLEGEKALYIEIEQFFINIIQYLNVLLSHNNDIQTFNQETQRLITYKDHDQFLKSKKNFKIKAEHNFMLSSSISFLTLTVPGSLLTQSPIFMHEVLRQFWDTVNTKLKKLGYQPSQDFPRMTVTELTKKGIIHYHNLFKIDLADILGVLKGDEALQWCYENLSTYYPKVSQANSYIFKDKQYNLQTKSFKTSYIKFSKHIPNTPIKGGIMYIPLIFIYWIEAFQKTLSNQKIINQLPKSILQAHYNPLKGILESKLPLPTSQDYTHIKRHKAFDPVTGKEITKNYIFNNQKDFYHQGHYRRCEFKNSQNNFMQNIIKYITKYVSKSNNNATNNILKLYNKRIFISSRACKKPVINYFQCFDNEIANHFSLKGYCLDRRNYGVYNFVKSSIRNPIKKYIIKKYLQEKNKFALIDVNDSNTIFEKIALLILIQGDRQVQRDYQLNPLKYNEYQQYNLYFYQN